MSHFTVFVFTRNNSNSTVKEQLAPYDERIIYAPYVKYTREDAIAKVRKELEDYKESWMYKEYTANPAAYKEKYKDNPGHLNYLENEYPKRLQWTDDECYEYLAQDFDEDRKDDNGNLYSTYNPNSKWDYWGEYNGLTTKSGSKIDETDIRDVDWGKTFVPFAFITPDGRWHERGEMGWWAIVTNEKDKDDWDAEFKGTLNKLMSKAEPITVTCVNCHI